MIELHLYGFLALLELLLLAGVLAGFLYLRNRRNTRTIARLRQAQQQSPAAATAHPAPTPPQADFSGSRVYSDFLRAELDASSLMLGTDATVGAQADPDADTGSSAGHTREMLAVRHQFLQLELDTQALDADPETRRERIVEQIQHLLATFTPAPAEGAGADADTLARERQLENQLDHLRTVVGNQQDVMRELRDLLEQEVDESAEMRDIIARLQDAEARGLELEGPLATVGGATPVSGEAGQGGAGTQGANPSPDVDMLRDLVGSQQQIISNLQNVLKQSVGEQETSQELRDALEKIQRSNQELGTCVVVLESENNSLRDQVESLQSQLNAYASDGTPTAAVPDAAGTGSPANPAGADTGEAASSPAADTDTHNAADLTTDDQGNLSDADIDALLDGGKQN